MEHENSFATHETERIEVLLPRSKIGYRPKYVWNAFIWLKVFSDVLPSTIWVQIFLLSQKLSSDAEMYLSPSCKGISIVIVDTETI